MAGSTGFGSISTQNGKQQELQYCCTCRWFDYITKECSSPENPNSDALSLVTGKLKKLQPSAEIARNEEDACGRGAKWYLTFSDPRGLDMVRKEEAVRLFGKQRKVTLDDF